MHFNYYLTFKPRGGSMTFNPAVTREGAVFHRSAYIKSLVAALPKLRRLQ